MNAIVEIAGKQFSIEKDAQIKVPKLNEKPGKKINFDKVLMLTKSGETRLGSPYLDDATFSAEIISHGRDKKVVVTCSLGLCAAIGGKLLKDMGYKDVALLEGGVTKWKEDGYDLEK